MRPKTLLERAGSGTGRVVLNAFLIFWAAAVIYPLVWMVISSFKDANGIYLSTWSLPDVMHWENYQMAWVDYSIGRAFLNTLFVTVLATVLNLILSLPTAYAIERYAFKGNSALMNFYLMAMMIPACMSWIPLYFLLNRFHMLDNLWVLALIYAIGKMPFSIYILSSFIGAVPVALEEAATLDGMSRYGILFRMIPKLIRSGIITVIVMNVIQFWSEYFMALIFAGSTKNMSLSVALYQLIVAMTREGGWSGMFAAVSLVSAPTIILYILLSKKIIGGVTAGGLKG